MMSKVPSAHVGDPDGVPGAWLLTITNLRIQSHQNLILCHVWVSLILSHDFPVQLQLESYDVSCLSPMAKGHLQENPWTFLTGPWLESCFLLLLS